MQLMTNQEKIMVIGKGCDASHRTYNIDTHPTHWPAAVMSQIMSNLSASLLVWRGKIAQYLGFFVIAYRKRIGGDL